MSRKHFVLGRHAPASPTGKAFVTNATIWNPFKWAADMQDALKFHTVKGAQRVQRKLGRAGRTYDICSAEQQEDAK